MIYNRKVTALVPVKEHSERVEGKNFRSFAGEPLYQHILRTLDRTYAVDEILVDTDSSKVMLEGPKVSRKVRIVERPDELKGDRVSTNRIFNYDIEQTDSDLFVQTHTTNPLLRAETIASVLSEFLKNEETHDSLFGANEHRSRFYTTDGSAVNHDPEHLIPTQELEPVYEENSCIYVFTRKSFMATGRRIGSKPYIFVTPRIESVDIDDEFTFKLAEIMALYGKSDVS